RELQVPLIVQRHRPDLAERILAVEHPAVGAREQRVRDVADTPLHGRIGFGGGTGSLYPLALKVRRNVAAGKCAVSRVFDLDGRPRDIRRWIEEGDTAAFARADC